MPSNRRRRRSVRISIAVLLLLVAGLVVLAALLIAEVLVLAVAAVVALVAGVVAVRLVLGELTRSRRHAAKDRASQARAYQKKDAERVDEHAAFAELMKSSLDDAKSTVGELRGTLRLAERRAELAEQRARQEAQRRGELENRLDDMAADGRPANTDLAAESDAAEDGEDGAGAVPYWDPEVPTVVDLLAWEDRAVEMDVDSDDDTASGAEADLA